MFQRIIVSCLVIFLAITSFAQEKTIHLEKTKFNSGFDDFGVRIFQDKIYVISTARDSVPVYDEKTGKPFTDIFEVQNELLVPAYLLSEKFGKELLISSHFYDGPITSNKDQTIVFFSNNSDPTLGDKMGLFYLKKNKSGAWSESNPFPYNSATFSNMHPYYDDANNTLYFSSNKTNGVGQFDIYAVTFDGVNFGEMRLVEGINSTANDTYPFVFDSVIFCASDRVEGLGGLDIYKMTTDKHVLNIGAPFNTTFDDFDITFLNENNGFFASNRQTTIAASDDDVYFFHYNEPLNVIAAASELATTNVQQFEQLTALSNNLIAAEKNNVYLNSANSVISASIKEMKLTNEAINNAANEFSKLITQISSSNNQIIADKSLSINERLAFEKHSNRLLQAIAQTNDPLLRALYIDSLANLSLINKPNSISKELLAQVFAKNNEFINLLKQQQSIQGDIDKATQMLLVEAAKPTNKINNPFLKEQLSAYQGAYNIPLAAQTENTELALSPTTIQKIADTYVSEPILFAFDSYQLSNKYDSLLLELAQFIKTNNAFQIYVDGYTDDKGLLSYNSKLSKKRALAVKRFLIKQGVKPTDFVVAYYGPEKPVASNDTSEGRKLNRRVEIRLAPRNN